MSARKGKNLKRVKYQLKILEDTTTDTSMRRALITAQKCVDKQIGQKPLIAENDYGMAWHSCPQCAGGLGHMVTNYCPNCGQKIGWWGGGGERWKD